MLGASVTSNKAPLSDRLHLPPVVFGTSGLGNLFVALSASEKLGIVKECIHLGDATTVFDSAGKYGAGLALESLGQCLKRLGVPPEQVVISNKLGWLRTELQGGRPHLEGSLWKDLKHDAVQQISYAGIMECYEQGNELLDGYTPRLVSVHDPDDYLAGATDERQAARYYDDILDAYAALHELKRLGKVQAVGASARDWRVLRRLAADVDLDWVMLANSLTLRSHPNELLAFIGELDRKGVVVINAAVFHSGFLVGGSFYDYKPVVPDTPGGRELFQWRADFFQLCSSYGIKPAEACVQFAYKVPGVKSIALNTSRPKRVRENVQLTAAKIPREFWYEMKAKGLIHKGYPYV
ncbi:aldo/keto reductase [Paraflavisolibacter sp. H34]|uniref:aldo/keto reductase n=1 Tax=Huijunlia imazamoxiresistens TaxID=3127457 RepID=UPI003019552B